MESLDKEVKALRLEELKTEAVNHLSQLINHGKSVCDDFNPIDSTYFCNDCHYSHAMHLYKRIISL